MCLIPAEEAGTSAACQVKHWIQKRGKNSTYLEENNPLDTHGGSPLLGQARRVQQRVNIAVTVRLQRQLVLAGHGKVGVIVLRREHNKAA